MTTKPLMTPDTFIRECVETSFNDGDNAGYYSAKWTQFGSCVGVLVLDYQPASGIEPHAPTRMIFQLASIDDLTEEY